MHEYDKISISYGESSTFYILGEVEQEYGIEKFPSSTDFETKKVKNAK